MVDMTHDEMTFLVTGATSGVGHAIAAQLAGRGARVLLGARSANSGRATVSAIRSRTPQAELEVVAADLSDMKQVRSLAEQVRQHTSRRTTSPDSF